MKAENRWIDIETPLLSKSTSLPMIRKQTKAIVSGLMKVLGPERNDGEYSTCYACLTRTFVIYAAKPLFFVIIRNKALVLFQLQG
jgi:hypothetical protein